MLITLFGLFPKPQKTGSTYYVTHLHNAGRGKGEIQCGSGCGQVPRAAVSLVRAADTLCGTLEKGENVHFIYVFIWNLTKKGCSRYGLVWCTHTAVQSVIRASGQQDQL